ncbi:Na+/H+ antiporter NhaA [Parabacteroides sp. 52]|uniref:Na+/H+ antiporter NhaA n=1 Tax=unclassified Parabacteroides TaxID=2649774 RepID=UPI0013D2C6CC|nr:MULTISPECIES: Na+/H+ antiporter NhaA [unclassified Parabacteroides]MDH6535285.1 NhaA family Na+:H+ antiporter [Parabacteroides sp. PM5-20]NDV55848.1 Na+/H+ antiporter NhaA [Parabacteroides sp. 52]
MERKIRVILKPLRRFAIQKPNASLLLFAATLLAMILANSPWASVYHDLLAFPINFHIGNITLFTHHGEPMSMLAFVNDALMAVFFFLIGLEIKQEILIGELSSVRKSILPVVAAFGGMIVPVLFYMLVCHSLPEIRGAAIPMATDIAFALAVLGALGKRVPLSMRIFLTALAVVDDIGGIIVIALFYSGHIAYEALLISAALLLVLYIGGKMRINNSFFYYAVGFLVWMFFLESGIHPTIAGVLIAFMVPARPVINLNHFTQNMKGHLDMLDFTEVRHSRNAAVLTTTQIHVLNSIHSLADRTISPLQSIADKLHPLVNYLILPLFAFVNAGVTFGDIPMASLLNVPLAVFLGLFLGKSLGIFSFSYLFVRYRWANMPLGMTKKSLFGVSMLGGIGFTVALFIANLSFDVTTPSGTDLLNQAKLGVFAGSFISGVCGYYLLNKILPKVE